MININEKFIEIPPLSPPPPPPCSPLPFSIRATQKSKCGIDMENETESFYEAISRIANLEGLHTKPFYAVNTYLKPQIQEGPKCGLFALSIATSKTNNFKSADELFVEAIKKGYTTYGEIYNCHHLADLAEKASNFKSYIISGGLNNHINCIFYCLQNEGLMLVPYDADCNHSPCCKKGHKAHWAAISGIAIFEVNSDGDESSERCDSDALEMDSGIYGCCDCTKISGFFDSGSAKNPKIVRHEGRVFVAKNGGDRSISRKGKILLTGRQGKSKHLAVWPFEKLSESNDNLIELSEQQGLKGYVLPDGGVARGLKGKAILLKCAGGDTTRSVPTELNHTR